MSKKSMKYIKTSLFVFFGVSLFVVFLLMVSNKQSLFYPKVEYRMKFEDVEGLFVGGIVTANGVKIGNVKEIEFEGNEVIVTIFVRKKYTQYVNQSSIASIKTQGVVGYKFISVQTPSTAPALEEGAFIPSTSGGLLSLLSGNEELVKSISSFLKEGAEFLRQVNEQSKKNGGVSQWGEISTRVQKLLSEDKNKDVKEILTRTKSILRKIDKGEGTLGALVNDLSLHKKAVSFLGGRPYTGFLKSIFSSNRPKRSKKSLNDEED